MLATAFKSTSTASPIRSSLLWLALTAGATALLVVFRAQLDEAHTVLIYLMVVLGASVQGGRSVGVSFAVLTFLCFNYFFLLPYHTLTVADPRDLLILVTYLVTALVSAELLTRARREAAERIRMSAETQHAAALRETDRLKDAVLAAVSHDLRTPLTSIKALADNIANDGDERAKVIGDQADRLSRFVAGLLDLSALNSGALRLNIEPNAVEDVIGAAMQATGSVGDHPVEIHIPTGAVMLGNFDFVYTMRVLANLLENAVKYSNESSPIEISASRSNGFVEIEVADGGPGIAPTERERVFEAFYRPDHATPDSNSAGLGLAIARRLAQAQGGSLLFKPRLPNGSRFILRLPAIDLDRTETTDS